MVQLNIQTLRSDRSMCLLRQFPYNYNFTPQLHVGLCKCPSLFSVM